MTYNLLPQKSKYSESLYVIQNVFIYLSLSKLSYETVMPLFPL